MIYVEVPKEIKEYDGKVIGQFSLRQVASLVISGVVGVLFYFFLINFLHIPTQIASYLVMAIVVPIFAVGWIEVHGMKFEQYFKIIMQFYTQKKILSYSDEYYMWNKKGEVVYENKKQKRKRNKEKKNIKEADL